MKRSSRLAPILLAGLAMGLCGPAPYDHLECFKVKDPIKLKGLLNVTSDAFGFDPECKVGKAKLYCTSASKEVLEAFNKKDPIEVLEITGPQEGDLICYKLKCAKRPRPDVSVADQFGGHRLSKLKPTMVCNPAATP
jgi:hypothetical protein